jgi:fibronectin type 3 domain-containing protein
MLAFRVRKWRIATLLPVLVASACIGFSAAPALADYPTGHDNTTNPAHMGLWTHGDPNTGLIPGSTSDGYYYLRAHSDGRFVWCEVYSGGDWQIQLIHGAGNAPVEAQKDFHGTGGRVAVTDGVAGDVYGCRISNISATVANGGQVQKDYAELNSANSSDVMTTGDCGGPGPASDPNFGGITPMEPAPPDPFPNGCSGGPSGPGGPGDEPYNASSLQVSPPVSQSFAVGAVASGGHAYTVTTTYPGDLTAVAFIGNKGTSGTLTIENSSGHVVNGQKWGARTANPHTQNQEYVGADAGVQPAGTYRIVYDGPANSSHDVYALNVEYPQPGQGGSVTVPGAPASLTATPGNGTSALSWTAPSDNGGASITGYAIYRGTTAGGESPAPVATVTGTSFTDTGLTDGTRYYYTVQALNSAGHSASSNEASDTPVASVPSAPQNLTVTGGAQQVALSWQAPPSNGSPVTGYDIYRGTASGQESLIASTVQGTTYTDTGLGLSTQYFYTVAAVNSAGIGAMSNEASATTNAPATEPSPPQNLAATAGSSSVALNWQVPASNGGSPVAGYNVYRGTSSGTETLLAPGVPGTSYTDSAVTSGTQYWYEVTAVNANGESADSNQVSATPTGGSGATAPGTPTGLTATPGDGQAVLNWTAPSSDGGTPVIGYDVYRSTVSGDELAVGSTDASTTSFTDGNLANGTTYYYEVTAVNAAGQSADSAEVSVTPASDGSGTFTGSLSDFHSATYSVTPTGNSLSAQLTWTGADEQLSIDDSAGAEVGHTQTGSSPLSDTVTVTPGNTYTVKVKDFASGSTSYTVTING